TDRVDRADLDVALARLQHFLSGPVPPHLGRGRVDAQVLIGQPEAPPVGEGDLQHVRPLVQRDERRHALAHGTGSYATRSKSAPRSSISVSRTLDDPSAWSSITRFGLYRPDASTSEAGEVSARAAAGARAPAPRSSRPLRPRGR